MKLLLDAGANILTTYEKNGVRTTVVEQVIDRDDREMIDVHTIFLITRRNFPLKCCRSETFVMSRDELWFACIRAVLSYVWVVLPCVDSTLSGGKLWLSCVEM
jgi:hypothetical protein